jgi:hypothetical protein
MDRRSGPHSFAFYQAISIPQSSAAASFDKNQRLSTKNYSRAGYIFQSSAKPVKILDKLTVSD